MLKKMLPGLAALALGVAAQAQTWPTKPITMVLPFPAGGAADVIGRTMADEMGKHLGQPVIVDNRPGAAGMLGTNVVAKAPPDGYTILFTPTLPVMTNQFLFAKIPYDVRKELAFISQVANGQLVLAVNPTVPVHSVKELIAWAGRNKGKVSYGSWSVGSYPHLAGAHMSQSHRLDMTHVPYKGEAPMLTDLAGGQITMAIGTMSSMRPYVDAGRIRALAVSGDKRLADLPEVPTFAQAGLTDVEYQPNGWLVMMAPAATPAPIRARLEKEAIAAVGSSAVKARLQAAGLEGIGSSAEQFRKDYDALMPVLERVVKASGARLD